MGHPDIITRLADRHGAQREETTGCGGYGIEILVPYTEWTTGIYGQIIRSEGIERKFCGWGDSRRCLEILGY